MRPASLETLVVHARRAYGAPLADRVWALLTPAGKLVARLGIRAGSARQRVPAGEYRLGTGDDRVDVSPRPLVVQAGVETRVDVVVRQP